MKYYSKYTITLFMLLVSFLVTAETRITRTYQLLNHELIQLEVPISWQQKLNQPSEQLPLTITFAPKTGSSFLTLVTIYSAHQGIATLTPSGMKAHVERAAESAKHQAVEKTIIVKELKDSSAMMGFYFSATDKSPKPSEYKYMTQGIFRIGDLTSAFTILTNEEAESIVTDSLTMLKSAVLVQKEPNN